MVTYTYTGRPRQAEGQNLDQMLDHSPGRTCGLQWAGLSAKSPVGQLPRRTEPRWDLPLPLLHRKAALNEHRKNINMMGVRAVCEGLGVGGCLTWTAANYSGKSLSEPTAHYLHMLRFQMRQSCTTAVRQVLLGKPLCHYNPTCVPYNEKTEVDTGIVAIESSTACCRPGRTNQSVAMSLVVSGAVGDPTPPLAGVSEACKAGGVKERGLCQEKAS